LVGATLLCPHHYNNSYKTLLSKKKKFIQEDLFCVIYLCEYWFFVLVISSWIIFFGLRFCSFLKVFRQVGIFPSSLPSLDQVKFLMPKTIDILTNLSCFLSALFFCDVEFASMLRGVWSLLCFHRSCRFECHLCPS
jgi:hypothetical protein